jgi:hypothetical protein
VTWPPPPVWTGVSAGACRVPELLDEFEEFDVPDDVEELLPELVPDEPELAEPELELVPGFALPWLDELLEDEVPVLVAAGCVEPGSTAATAPAAITLANPTVAVVAFSLRRPRSRSATACETSRLPRPGLVARGAP